MGRRGRQKHQKGQRQQQRQQQQEQQLQPLAKQPLALKKSHQEPEEKQKVSDDERPEESELQSVVASMEAAVAKATQSLTVLAIVCFEQL